MLRAMWRELETERRILLPGHEGGNPGNGQGDSLALPRQLSTLPRQLARESAVCPWRQLRESAKLNPREEELADKDLFDALDWDATPITFGQDLARFSLGTVLVIEEARLRSGEIQHQPQAIRDGRQPITGQRAHTFQKVRFEHLLYVVDIGD